MKPKEIKYCANEACGKPLREGRADMKFCNAKCRSANYQALHRDTIAAEKSLTRGNRNNEKVLKLLFHRLPKSQLHPKYIDISLETLKGAGYDMEFFGIPKMIKWGNKTVQAYKYHNIIMVSHPDQPNRFLITAQDETT